MKKLLTILAIAIILFLFCSQSIEQKADSFYKKGNMRNAYIYYQKAIEQSRGKASQQLKDKYLKLTIDRAKDRLINDESLESVSLFHEEFMKYAGPTTAPAIINGYVDFMCNWADSIFTKFENVNGCLKLMEDGKKLAADNQKLATKELEIKKKFAKVAYENAQEAYKNAKEAENPLDMVGAEYYALLAKKYVPDNDMIDELLRKTRKQNLGTYSAYDRAMPDGITDPAIDKCNVYMAVTKSFKSKSDFTVEGMIYNLSPNPIKLMASQFTLVDKDGNTYAAKTSSKFEKTTIDVKFESKFTLKFPGTKAGPKAVQFKEGEQFAEKCWP